MSPRATTCLRLLLWFGSLALLSAAAVLRLDRARPVDTNLLDLLPAAQQSAALDAATTRTQAAFLRELLLVVSAADDAAARRGALAAQAALDPLGLHLEDPGADIEQLLELYRQHHYAFLTASDAARLERAPVGTFTSDAAAEFASPAGMLGVFGTDPGGYLSRYVQGLPQPYPGFAPDGPFMAGTKQGQSHFLLRVLLPEAALGSAGAQLATQAEQAARTAVLAACPGCSFRMTGAALFAAAAEHDARQEIFWLSLLSTVFIVLLTLAVFRDIKPLLLGVLCMGVSVAAGAAAVVACFGSIHILTLVCGTTLLGIAIDYAFLYFAEYWFGGSEPLAVPHRVLPGLSMGLVTGLIAFGFLLFAGFPALSQIAVFSVLGLLAAYATVMLLYPSLLRSRPRILVAGWLAWPQDFMRLACRRSHWRYSLPLLLLLLSVPGWFRLQTSDDVRELQSFPPGLLAADVEIRTLLGQTPPPGFFLIEGSDAEQTMRREEALFALLTPAFPDANSLGLTRFLPSAQRQQAALALWTQVFADPKALAKSFARIGLPAEYLRIMRADWQKNQRAPLLPTEVMKIEPALGQFQVQTGAGSALIATLFTSAPDVSRLTSLAAQVPGVTFVAPLLRLADTFRAIRWRASWLVVASYVLISLLLLWRYGRGDSLRMLYPPLLTLAVTLGALGWQGQPINIFVIVGLILVLGVGRDYTVFLREGHGGASTALGVTLAALATLCSFGLLAFSRVPALHVFGLATLIGILVSYLSAPLSMPPESHR